MNQQRFDEEGVLTSRRHDLTLKKLLDDVARMGVVARYHERPLYPTEADRAAENLVALAPLLSRALGIIADQDADYPCGDASCDCCNALNALIEGAQPLMRGGSK